ncbi:MAG: hypothetical protein ACE3JP_06160 [Ectobacillus sp.]
MTKDITIFIESLAFLGIVCCLLIYNTNLLFLGVLIAFVLCEIIMELLKVKLKRRFAHIYSAVVLTCITITSTMINGIEPAAIFPVFFTAILLVISQYGFILEPNNNRVHYKDL